MLNSTAFEDFDVAVRDSGDRCCFPGQCGCSRDASAVGIPSGRAGSNRSRFCEWNKDTVVIGAHFGCFVPGSQRGTCFKESETKKTESLIDQMYFCTLCRESV